MEELIECLKSRGIDYEDRKEEIDNYFIYLERLRESGVTNMFGAGPYLEKGFNLSPITARNILACWIKFYDLLSNKLGWDEE